MFRDLRRATPARGFRRTIPRDQGTRRRLPPHPGRLATTGRHSSDPRPISSTPALPTVLQIVYLIFNEAHTATRGSRLHRADLADEAIRLARQLHHRLPNHSETAGLLALLLLTDARRSARIDSDGELVPLDRQDRQLWNKSVITEGLTLLTAVFRHHQLGDYQLQAAIAAVHAQAGTFDGTKWTEIQALYNLLARRNPNPLIDLNRAVAVAHTDGPERALQDLAPLAQRLADHHRYHATIGYIHALRGDPDAARHAYAIATQLATNEPARRYLQRKATL